MIEKRWLFQAPIALSYYFVKGSLLSFSHFLIVDRYLKVAQEKHSYSPDQALGMLYFHSYDINRALVDLPNFCPVQGLCEGGRMEREEESEGIV